MNRLARLAALARVASQNLPSAIATEGQVRFLRMKNIGGCCYCANLGSVGFGEELSGGLLLDQMIIIPQDAACFQRSL